MNQDDRIPMVNVAIVTSPKWIRAFFGGQMVASSRRVKLKRGRPMHYYFPRQDVNMDYLQPVNSNGLWDVRVGEAVAQRAAFAHADDEALVDHISFRWRGMDAWFEEDEQVFTHPRDPYVRLETLQSSRHVRVVTAGEVVAETRRPVLLLETGLPTRYYMPKTDARMDLLVPSDSHTACPYKGEASYFSLKVGDTLVEDAVWYYPFPDAEVSKIQGLLCFYPEKADEFVVDGEATL